MICGALERNRNANIRMNYQLMENVASSPERRDGMTERDRKTLNQCETAKPQLRFNSRRNLGTASAFSKRGCIQGAEQTGTDQG